MARDFVVTVTVDSSTTVSNIDQFGTVSEVSMGGPPGQSAYQIAVANGFVGSQTAWIQSLKGLGVLLIEHGATVPAATPIGTVIFEKSV